MPLEIQLNAVHREYYLAESRNSVFLIEERRTGKTTGEVWTWHVVGSSANYGSWILNQKCCMPELGERLMIQTTDSMNDVVITTKIRKLRKV